MSGARRLRLFAAWAVLLHGILAVAKPAWSLRATGASPFVSDVLPWILLAALLVSDLATLRRLGRLLPVETLKVRRGILLKAGLAATAGAVFLAGATHDPLPGESGWTVAAQTSGAGFFTAEVFLLVLGATAVAGESSAGTLKMILPHAYRRSDWVLAKGLVLVLATLVFAIVASAASLGHAAMSEGVGDVTRDAEPTFGEEATGPEVFRTADVMAGHLREAFLCSWAALAATTLLGVLLSCVFRGVVSALCSAFLLFGVLGFADLVLRLPRESLQRIYAWYPGQLRDLTASLGRGLNERWDGGLLPTGLVLALLTSVLATLLAIHVLDRRDLQS